MNELFDYHFDDELQHVLMAHNPFIDLPYTKIRWKLGNTARMTALPTVNNIVDIYLDEHNERFI